MQLLGGLLAHPPQLVDGQRVQEGGGVLARHHQQAVGLGPARGQLGQVGGGRDPDRAADALLVGDPGPQLLGHLRRAAQPAAGTGHVEERLVERHRLDQRGDRPEGLHHRGRHRANSLEVGLDHDRLRAQPARPHPGMADRTPCTRAS